MFPMMHLELNWATCVVTVLLRNSGNSLAVSRGFIPLRSLLLTLCTTRVKLLSSLSFLSFPLRVYIALFLYPLIIIDRSRTKAIHSGSINERP